jgi:DNA-binding MarR family transcriptional regulator
MATGHDLAMALRAAYLAMHRRTDAALTRHRVTADQFVLLAALAGGEAVTQKDLGRRTASDPNTVRAMLLILERQGLVGRRPHPTDGRARTVDLTPKGRRLYAALWAATGPVRQELTAALSPDDGEALLGLLARITRAMTPPAPTPTGAPA